MQLNDTHPALAIVEMQRLLVDLECLGWDEAWGLVRQCFAFTNHTVLPEALERWPLEMLRAMLPRHTQIILDVNMQFLRQQDANDWPLLKSLSLIEEGPVQHVRMAHLAIVGSHAVNGVAAMHTKILKETLFSDFLRAHLGNGQLPLKFLNVTNGITPRRWLHQANPLLSALISRRLGTDGWLKDLNQLAQLTKTTKTDSSCYFLDGEFVEEWAKIKLTNKARLARLIREICSVQVPCDEHILFDVQVKRIHEYKRQLMNILWVIHKWLNAKKQEHSAKDGGGSKKGRVVIFAGKAAPGYVMAKLVIKLINDVAAKVNATSDTLKVNSLIKPFFVCLFFCLFIFSIVYLFFN